MRDLIEQYLARVGSRTGMILIGTAIAWGAIVIAVAFYAVVRGTWVFGTLTWAAVAGDPVDIVIAVALWVLFGLSCLLAHALYEIWLAHRAQRWAAELALDRLEQNLYPGQEGTGYVEKLRDRLAVRAIETMEAQVLGKPREKELALEDRLIELDAEVHPEADP